MFDYAFEAVKTLDWRCVALCGETNARNEPFATELRAVATFKVPPSLFLVEGCTLETTVVLDVIADMVHLV